MSFGAIALLIVYMASASVLEKFYGTGAVMKWGYHSPVFIGLWATAALSGVACLYLKIIKGRRLPEIAFATAGIHIALVLILAGALLTHVSGRQGTVHLRTGGTPVTEYLDENGMASAFPFAVSLEAFRVEYHPGSYAPSDYVSTVKVVSGDEETVTQVSMNSIFRYRGYRFCQAAYDDDAEGATLAVSHDPAGVAVTYSGYLLLLVSMVCFFFQKDSGFRESLRRVSGKATATLLLFIVPGLHTGVSASEVNGTSVCRAELKYLPKEVAEEYGRMYVYYNDRICQIQTLAGDFAMKLYGKKSYKGLSAEQVLTGWIFFYDSWRQTVGDGPAGGHKDEIKARDREDAIMLVCSARLLKIFPYKDADGKVTWYSSVDTLPLDMDDSQWIFVRKVMSLAGESIVKKDYASASGIFGKIREFQEKEAADVLPSGARIGAERIYNAIGRPGAAAMLCLGAGLLLFIFRCFSGQGPVTAAGKIAGKTVFILSVGVFVYLSAVFILRWYVSAHVPMSNGFETMMLLAWHVMMLTVFVRKKYPLIQPFGFLLAGFALLVASLGGSDPRITHMMPVLSSPLLSVHVMCMMISYTLLGLVMLNGLMALVRHYASGKPADRQAFLSRMVLYPAVFFLAAGTFLGAVWANVSWGRYWAWDPKEVWALVTLLVYAFALHGNSLKAFRRPVFFHWFCVLAFLCVIITYFGVNFFLGGLHGYA